MIPLWEHGNGWNIHVDFSAVDDLPINQIGECWSELCKCNDLIGSNQNMIFRFRTKSPENLFPGYYSRIQVMKSGDWLVNANGTTPRNAAEWSDMTQSPYYYTPTCFVKWTISPVYVAHAIVHELFHLHMPYGLHTHNSDVGTIFQSPMANNPTITPEAEKRLAPSIDKLARGYRIINGREAVIPHKVSPDTPKPEAWTGIGPPTTGPLMWV